MGRFSSSRWDGTQRGFDIDADAVLAEISDDLIHHGDVNAALRRMLQSGFEDRDGQRIQGLREMLEKLRQERRERLENFDLGGVYNEIAESLKEVVDMERGGIEDYQRDARESGDERRREIADEVAAEKNMELDMLPSDLAGQVRELSNYDFTSPEARQKFEELMEQLKQELANQYFNQVQQGMQNMSPEDMQRMKDMMADLNHMLEQREAGEEPNFEEFMEKYGDFFPENPQSLDELLEQMAQRMAAAQAMLNSMSPEQRAQLQALSDQLMEDMDLRWQMDQLSQNLQNAFPQAGWGKQYRFTGDEELSFGEASQMMNDLGDLDRL